MIVFATARNCLEIHDANLSKYLIFRISPEMDIYEFLQEIVQKRLWKIDPLITLRTEFPGSIKSQISLNLLHGVLVE